MAVLLLSTKAIIESPEQTARWDSVDDTIAGSSTEEKIVLSGKVMDSTDASAVSGATVGIHSIVDYSPLGPVFEQIETVPTDHNGSYEISFNASFAQECGGKNFHITENCIKVVVSAPGYVEAETYYLDGAFTDYDFALVPTASLTLTLSVNDAIAALIQEGVESYWIPSPFVKVSEGSTTVEFRDIPVGKYSLVVSSPEHHSQMIENVIFRKHEKKDLQVILRSYVGNVTLNGCSYYHALGAPAVDHILYVRNNDEIVGLVKTNQTGNFTVLLEVPGIYEIQCRQGDISRRCYGKTTVKADPGSNYAEIVLGCDIV